MNILNRVHYQRGVGLIEILIALVVIGVGVIAILGLQGTLMSGSATTKARNEAVALAREKTEELRNAVELGQFDAELVVQDFTDDPDGAIDGVNAQFTRSWKIVDIESVENTRELVMQVTWTDAQDVYNKVELNTLIAYASPLTSALSQEDNAHALPAPGTNTGYEGLHSGTPKTGGADDRSDALKALEDTFGIETIFRYTDSGHVQVRIAHTEGDDCPHQDIVDDDYCVVFTAFGGTLLRLSGTLYVDGYLGNVTSPSNSEDNLLVKATSPSYCAQKYKTCEDGVDIDGPQGVDCIEYLCYASGDCTDGGFDCPTGQALADMKLRTDLNGGWHGKVGHYFPAEKSSNFPTICMSKSQAVDDVGNPLLDGNGDPVLVDNEITARSYYSLRDSMREGINRSYACHDTLIVDSTSNSGDVCDTGYAKLVSAGIAWDSFVGPEVIRGLDTDTNVVQATDISYCSIISISGVVKSHPDWFWQEVSSQNVLGVTVTTRIRPFYQISVENGIEGLGGCSTKVIASPTEEDPEGYSTEYACNFVSSLWTGSASVEVTGEFVRTEEKIKMVQDVDENGDKIFDENGDPVLVPDTDKDGNPRIEIVTTPYTAEGVPSGCTNGYPAVAADAEQSIEADPGKNTPYVLVTDPGPELRCENP